MSQLAYDKNGAPIDPPAEVVGWQVRRLPANRGAPVLVYGELGTPLVVPVDAEAEEFRKLVQGEPGRYRLDPVDGDHRLCEGSASAVVQLSGDAANDEEPADRPSGPNGLVRELLAQNRELMDSTIEMAKSIAAGQADVISATATLVKAADGAGLASREPTNLLSTIEELRNAFTPSEDEESNSPASSAPSASSSAGVQQVLAMKAINEFLPLAQYLIQTKWMGLTPEQAATLTGVGAVPPPQNTNSKAPADDGGESDDGNAHGAEQSAQPPMSDQALMAHMMEIQAALSPRERNIAMAAAMKMTAEQQEDWKRQLGSLSVDEAVEVVRTQVAGGGA